MTGIKQLAELKMGQKAVISELVSFSDMRRRLQDIGLIEGTLVECVGKSPLGDPAAYLIRGAVIALRSEDSGKVLVRCGDEAVECNLENDREYTVECNG